MRSTLTILSPSATGAWYHDLGDFEKAADDYDESIRINGRNAEVYLYRGNLFLERNSPKRAMEDFDHAVHLDEEMAAAWLSRAKSLATLGRRDEAEDALAKAGSLGADISDVALNEIAPSTAPVPVTLDTQQLAIDFVAAELTKAGKPAEPGEFPWDLTSGEGSSRYVVRLLPANSRTGSQK